MKLTAIGAASLVLQLATSCWALEFRTVVLTRQAAPGTAPGISYSNVFTPAINDSGQVAFDAATKVPGTISQYRVGTWSEGGGVLRKVAFEDDTAPGVSPPTTFRPTSIARINDAGQSAFMATLGNGTRAIFSEGSGSLDLIVREGQQAPGMAAGITFDFLSQVPVINDLGQVAFTSFVEDLNGNHYVEGIWTNRGGSVNLVAASGSVVPGTSTKLAGVGSVLMNDVGHIAFGAHIDGPGIIQSGWTDMTGTLTEVMRDGLHAFGFPSGVNYGAVSLLKINNAGHVAFGSSLTGVGIDDSNDHAIWEGAVDAYRIVAQKGDPAPGVPVGAMYADLNGLILNGAGGVSFLADLTGVGVTTTNDTGVWREGSSGLELVAREGTRAPGTAPGIVFGDLSSLGNSSHPLANSAGQVAFMAKLTGPGITTSNDRGIWATDLSGQLRLISREGDSFDVNDDPLVDDIRTIRLVQITTGGNAGEDGKQSALNGAGQLAIRLSFTNATAGVFVVETAVPEPASGTLIAMAVIATTGATRRQCGRRRRPH